MDKDTDKESLLWLMVNNLLVNLKWGRIGTQ